MVYMLQKPCGGERNPTLPLLYAPNRWDRKHTDKLIWKSPRRDDICLECFIIKSIWLLINIQCLYSSWPSSFISTICSQSHNCGWPYWLAVNWHLYLTGQPIRKPLPSLSLLLVNNSTLQLYTVQCGRSLLIAAVNHFHALSPRCSVYCPEQGNPRRRGKGGY